MGIGIDVVDVARLSAALERTPSLMDRVFTDLEQGLPVESLAARLAAKEAVGKALGRPSGLRWVDAEVLSEPSGRPVLRLHGTAAELANRLEVGTWHVSLSHDAGIATAIVIAETAGETSEGN